MFCSKEAHPATTVTIRADAAMVDEIGAMSKAALQ
jgi:hypothetical protein